MVNVDIETLREFKLFKNLTVTELEAFIELCVEKKAKADEMIIKENMPGKELYVIIEGTAKISKLIPTGDRMTFTTMKKGNFFGGISLITEREHSATVQAVEDTTLMVITKTKFDKFLETYPQGGFRILNQIMIEISDLLVHMNNIFVNMMSYIWR